MADHALDDQARVEEFHVAIWELNEPIIRALLAEDPNLIYKRVDNNDCMATLFDRYFRYRKPDGGTVITIEEIFRIMDVLFELGYKPTLNRFFSVKRLDSGRLHVVVTNLFNLFIYAGFKGIRRQLLKKLLERMSDEELDYLDSFRFPIYSYTPSNERDRHNSVMNEISKIIAEIRKYKERFQNISHLSNMFSNANRGHIRVSDAAGAGAGAGADEGEGAPASRLPPRSKLGKASGNVRNLIGSFLSGETGTMNNQLSFLRTKLSRTEPALAAAGAGAAAGGAGGGAGGAGAGAAAGGAGGGAGGAGAAAGAANAALLSRPGPPNSQLINYFNNNQNGGRRRVSRKSRQRKYKTMRRRHHK
jgi:hypothetical protein